MAGHPPRSRSNTVGTPHEAATFGGGGGEGFDPIACGPETAAVAAAIGTGTAERTGYITAIGLGCQALRLK